MKNYQTYNRPTKVNVWTQNQRFLSKLSFVLIFFSSIFGLSFAQTITCVGTVADSGGTGGNYMNNENITETYCSDAGNQIKLTFTAFDLEQNFDFLFIYDGASSSDPIIGVYTNSSSPGAVLSTNGCLTLVFQSDASTVGAGYVADISCTAACDIMATGNVTTSATCGNDDGSIIVNATGASGTLEFSINGGASYQASNTFMGVAAGTYQSVARYTDGTCITAVAKAVINSGCTEICNNGIDDDGDTDVDAMDMDCDNTIVTCDILFTDDNLNTPPGHYTFDTMYVNTFCSDDGSQILATFTAFSLGQSAGNIDTLIVFDGPDTLSTLIGKYYGTSAGAMNDEFRAKSLYQSTTSCLTFQFKSIDFGSGTGWEANISCTTPVTSFGVEICGNGIDDDFDGLIDFQDADCPESLDPVSCLQGFNYYIPPVWKMSGNANSYSSPAILCLSTNSPTAMVNLSTANGSYSRDILLTANTPDTILYSELTDILRTDLNNTIESNKGLIVTSDNAVQLLYILDGNLNKNLITVKGKEAEGKSFRVGSQTNTLVQSSAGMTREEHHFISVMATEDNTNVTIASDRPLEGVISPLTINLNRGDSYLVIDEGFNVTVSGALVTSDKNIVVTSGSQHTSASGVTEDDGGVDMLVPVRSTGNEYVLMRGGVDDVQDYGTVVAIENNTDVFVNGAFVANLNAGEFAQIDVTGALGLGTYVNTSENVYMYQVSGLSLGEVGMAIVPAIGACRGDKSASFSRFNSSIQFGLNIIIPTVGLATLQLNGAPFATFPSATVQLVPSLPTYSTVNISDSDIATLNTLTSDEFFNASLLIGNPIFAGTFGFITSFSEKVDILDPETSLPTEFYVLDTICRNDVINASLNAASCGNTNKIRKIEQGTLGTAAVTGDLSFSYSSNGTVGEDVISVTVINEFGIQSTVCIGIRIDSVYVAFMPADSTICSGETITLAVDSVLGQPAYSYLWSTMETTQTIDVNPLVNTSYSVTVTDGNGCTGVDEFAVTIEMSVVADAGPNVTICQGQVAQLDASQPMGTTGMWTGGTGTFDDPTDPQAQYTPADTETDEMLMLYWTLDGNTGSVCFDGTDSITLTITPALMVFAGDDMFVCEGIALELASLNAEIFSAIITTGVWSSDGDGEFTPGNTATGIFPSSVSYIPGVQDAANGDFTLTLTADEDPNTTGPCDAGSDDVLITINETPVLACNDNLNISVNSSCLVDVNVDMLIENPIEPLEFYTITLRDEFGNDIAGTILNSSYIGRTIEYSVGYECGNNSCWGNLTIEDKQIPKLEPTTVTVDCRDDLSPEAVGFPLPFGVNIFPTGTNSYFVEGFDGCSTVTLTYDDDINEFVCDGPFQTVIYRSYVATDAAGNSTTGIDTINVERISLADVILPRDYDDVDLPTISCDATFPTTDEGFPSPEFTGTPDAGACSMIQSTYTDVTFPMCGNTYKVLREWLIFDWCTSESIKVFQTIKITDKTPPTIVCQLDVTISTDDYSCNSGLYLIPQATTTDNCSSVTVTVEVEGPDGESIEVINGNLVADLPLGTSTITYTASDECGNENTCSYNVTTVDIVPPTPVCEGHTEVSLNNVGNARLYAASIDDGSHDNCAIALIEVAKMSDQCGFGTLVFGDYVDFCCDELGAPIMIAFRVTDIYGNSNICMTEVSLQDKIAPVISAPTNLTISCTTPIDEDDLSNFGTVALSSANQNDIVIFDEENNGVAGMDGVAIDNCYFSVTEEVDIDIDCGVGEIRRTFTAIDAGNPELKASAVQIIKVVNSSPFNNNNINWPSSKTVTGCNNLDSDPDVTGRPSYNNEDCASIVSSYEDKTFTVVDSACVLILRTWKVLDMCQFNANNGTGIWTKVQSIKLNNVVAPTFTSTCADTTVCTYGLCGGLVELSIEAEDDCTDESLIVYAYTIDADDNGSIEYSGNSKNISRILADGSYRVRWTAEDLCGNITSCNYMLTVKDCKQPTPYCLGGISTALMNNVGEVTITAEDFDLGSFDNCTDEEDLIFSFSSNTSETTMLITCDMLENGVMETLELEMWVTDLAGNQDYCSIEVTVQDNFDICPNAGTSTIEGMVITSNDDALKSAEIMLSSDFTAGNQSIITTNDGEYAFYDLPSGITYTVSGSKNDDMLNGLTTLDVVLIQKHILGLSIFADPYQYIAADVNNSGGITGIDIIQVRKAILGYYDEFPDNTSWRFVDASYDFADNNYFEFPEYVGINQLSDDVDNANLTAVKIGDVNGTSTGDEFNNTDIDSRNNDVIEFELVAVNANTIEVFALEDVNIAGMQMELSWRDQLAFDIEGIGVALSENQVRLMDNGVKIAYNNEQGNNIEAGQTMFRLVFEADVDAATLLSTLILNPTAIYPELYTNELEAREINISVRGSESDDLSLQLYQNTPNPFESATSIAFDIPEQDRVELQVIDASGKIVYRKVSQAQKGYNVFTLDKDDLSAAGVYYYQLNTSFGIATQKMILMK